MDVSNILAFFAFIVALGMFIFTEDKEGAAFTMAMAAYCKANSVRDNVRAHSIPTII